MNFKNNKISGQSSRQNKDRVVKNDYYYNCKKKAFIKRGAITAVVVSLCGVVWYIKEVPVKAEVIMNNNVLEWNPSRDNLKGITFEIFKDGNKIHETSQLKFIDEKQKDTGAPSEIKEIETYRNIGNIKIAWKIPDDRSSNNKYQVFATNRMGLKVFKTEEISGGIVSGVDKYVVKFNGKEYQAKTPEFTLETKDLKPGTYTIEIKSVDKAGNSSEFKTFAFDYHKIDFNFKEGKLIPKDSRYTNESHNFYMIDKALARDYSADIPQYDKKMFLINENLLNILDSGMKPTMTSPSYVKKNEELIFSWSKPKSGKSTNEFYVEAVNKETLERTYSDLIEIESSSNMLGYHYALNTSSDYTVTPNDKYTSSNSVSVNLKELKIDKKYYFHIATIDNSGIMSMTKTIQVNVKTSNSFEYKKSLARQVVFKSKGLNNSDYKIVVEDIANNYNTTELKRLKEEGVKIYVFDEDFKEILSKEYGLKAENDILYKKNKTYYFNSTKNSSSLINSLNKLI